MSFLAITLLFISAVLHTTWNVLLKQASKKYIATWWAMLAGSVIFLPALFFTGLPAREVWPLVLVSVFLEMGYYALLSAAYADSDFSLIYPLARGAAPALIALWSVLFLDEKLSLGGVLGLGLILIGLLVIGWSTLLQQDGRPAPHLRGILLALLLALVISFYSIIDAAAVRHTAAFPYAISIFFLMPIFNAPIMFHRYGWQTLKQEWLDQRRRLAAIGLLSTAAYFLVLAAYSISLVSYTGAIREVSVVLGALAGWVFLGEQMGSRRVIGSLAIFLGILVIAVWG